MKKQKNNKTREELNRVERERYIKNREKILGHAPKCTWAGMTEKERFWSKVEKTNYCWLWTRGKSKSGYGIFKSSFIDHSRPAHRQSWIWANNSEIPPGMFICHRCDNRICVRPSHLFLGTQKDNMGDCSKKGRTGKRAVSGEKNPASVLTEADVLSIRNSYKKGMAVVLGTKYGVTSAAILRVVHRQTWRHL